MTLTNRAIDKLKGVGPKKRALYEKMGITTTDDLLSYFPAAYLDYRNPKCIKQLKAGEDAITCGKVVLHKAEGKKYRKNSFRIVLEDCGARLEVFFFNSFYLYNTIKLGDYCHVYGRVKNFRGKITMTNPMIIDEQSLKQGIMPVYRTAKGISQAEMRKNIKMLLEETEFVEYLPEEIISKNNLCPSEYTFYNLHFPKDREHYKKARYRRIYEDLLIMQLGMEQMKQPRGQGIKMLSDVDEYLDLLPFQLTDAQKKVLGDIESDMSSDKAMNRLVQGDVGSGKTAVAAAAMYKAVKSGYQAAMMAPTEILAKQHFESLKENYEKLGISVCLLTGGMKTAERRDALNGIKSGKYQIVIGTHALIQKDVEYHNIGLVITDEQHRFGVNQRMRLGAKGENPHILVMTATPIPRTLAVILYGDLDMSLIDALPAGRKKIITEKVSERDRKSMYLSLIDEIKEGRQVYVVAPLIEESESMEGVKSTDVLYDELSELYGDKIKIAVVHGAMKQEEKDNLMDCFGKGEISILIATSVIEVGIDVPNATVMVIENAERFGLAQLHQLRGRVGRGEHLSKCFIINRSSGNVAKERMDIMCKSSDGFFIAEKDLQLRGPGEIFGIRQHGIPDECLMNAVKHIDILEKAQKDAKFCGNNINAALREKVDKMFNGNAGVSL